MIKYLSITIVFLLSGGCKTNISTPQSYIDELNTHRSVYKMDFKNNERGPLKTDEDVSLMDFYDADINYVCKCKITKESSPTPIVISTYADNKKDFIVYGRAICSTNEHEFTLGLYQNAQSFQHPLYGKKLFLPFKDFTNGEESYGGGRYLDLSKDDIKDDILTIDFNHAYNPWCAYSDGYNCPVPPVENHLQFKLEAGERNYRGEVKH